MRKANLEMPKLRQVCKLGPERREDFTGSRSVPCAGHYMWIRDRQRPTSLCRMWILNVGIKCPGGVLLEEKTVTYQKGTPKRVFTILSSPRLV